MIATLNFAGLILATILAAVAAIVCNWLFLRVMFSLMRPAAEKRPTVRTISRRIAGRSEGFSGPTHAAESTVTAPPQRRREWEKGAAKCWS